MLLNRDTADGIANGNITLVLRRWDVPRAKAGGTQRTSAGTIRIDAVTQYPGSYRVTAAPPWTREFLGLIAANEGVRAPGLAARVGLDTPHSSDGCANSRGRGQSDGPDG